MSATQSASPSAESPVVPPKPFRVIGTRPVRPDGEDKVTGRAQYGADLAFADQLWGAVLRSPHAHARIVSIDTSAAQRLPGVRAVITHADLPAGSDTKLGAMYLAQGKTLYQGHPVAAVAARDRFTAEEALRAIAVTYERLPAYASPGEAMAEGALPLHGEVTVNIMGESKQQATNVVTHTRFEKGAPDSAWSQADLVIEHQFSTKTVHQGYIEPHSASALTHRDGQIEIWTSTQGPFWCRADIARLLKVPLSQVKVTPMEIGGGFGGKIPVYLEPLAALLSKATGHPVKLVMSRQDCFTSTGPASATESSLKIGVTQDGRIVAAEAELAYEAGAFPPGTYAAMGALCMFAPYDIPNARVDAYDVLTNTAKVAAYRAPSAPQAAFAVESCLDEIAQRLQLDPLELRLKNAAKEGTECVHGIKYPRIGVEAVIKAALESEHYRSAPPSKPNQARAVGMGMWFNAGMSSTATLGMNLDGTASLVTGSVDIGGQRAALAMIAAEVLGLEAHEVRPRVADTDSVGHTDVTGGSRTTYATGTAVHDAAQGVVQELKKRYAKLQGVDAKDVQFAENRFSLRNGQQNGQRNGHAHANGGTEAPAMSTRALGRKLARTGGPVSFSASVSPNRGVGAGFGCHIADIEVDAETGKVTILRYTAIQDVGQAIHPSYVEGQMQGGAVQGIGWALNEEYYRNAEGEMLNAGFLDYRMPTMLDVPRIETILVEEANPGHPFGVRGVGETPIVPPIGTLHNAIARATGVRLRELPMSPPKVVEALQKVQISGAVPTPNPRA